jgi:hypothetical protein
LANDVLTSKSAVPFGELLHTVQDFYAHSNWVEQGRTDLLNNSTDAFPKLMPWQQLGDAILVATWPPFAKHEGYDLKREKRIITVTHSGKSLKGIITGFVVSPKMQCPDEVALGHWKSAKKDDDGLNKDEPSRAWHEEARSLAVQQTQHEWCRLVALTRKEKGEAGVEKLFDRWVGNVQGAKSACGASSSGGVDPGLKASNYIAPRSLSMPSVKLKTTGSHATVVAATTGRGAQPASILYTTSLSADTKGIGGEANDLRYEWRKNGKLLDVKVPGPTIVVSIGPGEQATYDVSVFFASSNSELAHDTLVIEAPRLIAAVAPTCPGGKDALVTKFLGAQPGKGGRLKVHQQQLCKNTTLTASAAYGPGLGAVFPAVARGQLTYEWADLRFASGNNKHTKIPASWLEGPSANSVQPSRTPRAERGGIDWAAQPSRDPSRSPSRLAASAITLVAATTAAVTITPTGQTGFLALEATVTVRDAYGTPPAIIQYVGSNDFALPEYEGAQ